MKEIIGRRFYRNEKFNVMYGIIALLNVIPFILYLKMGSPAGMSNLVLAILFIVLVGQKNKPQLSFQKSHFEYKAAALGKPVQISYDKIESTNTYGNKLMVRIKSKAKPISIHLINFNKLERDNIVECFSRLDELQKEVNKE